MKYEVKDGKLVRTDTEEHVLDDHTAASLYMESAHHRQQAAAFLEEHDARMKALKPHAKKAFLGGLAQKLRSAHDVGHVEEKDVNVMLEAVRRMGASETELRLILLHAFLYPQLETEALTWTPDLNKL